MSDDVLLPHFGNTEGDYPEKQRPLPIMEMRALGYNDPQIIIALISYGETAEEAARLLRIYEIRVRCGMVAGDPSFDVYDKVRHAFANDVISADEYELAKVIPPSWAEIYDDEPVEMTPELVFAWLKIAGLPDTEKRARVGQAFERVELYAKDISCLREAGWLSADGPESDAGDAWPDAPRVRGKGRASGEHAARMPARTAAHRRYAPATWSCRSRMESAVEFPSVARPFLCKRPERPIASILAQGFRFAPFTRVDAQWLWALTEYKRQAA